MNEVTSKPFKRTGLYEYPDTIVAEFLLRVQSLTEKKRDLVEGRTHKTSWGGRVRALLGISSALTRRHLAAIAIEGCTAECDDKTALREYDHFWLRLRRNGWKANGLIQVASSLRAVRDRNRLASQSPQFSYRLSQVVSPTSLGWPEGDAFVDEGEALRESLIETLEKDIALVSQVSSGSSSVNQESMMDFQRQRDNMRQTVDSLQRLRRNGRSANRDS